MPRRGENIYHRKDGRWEGRYINGYRENGRARYASVYAPSYREVKQKLVKRKEQRHAGITASCRLTVKVLCLEWLEGVRSSVKESSYARYSLLVERHIIPALGGLRAEALTANVLSRYLNSLLENGRLDGKGGLSPKTAQDIAIIVKAVMKLMEREYGTPSHAASVKLPKVTPPEMKLLSDEDIRRLETLSQDVKASLSDLGVYLCIYTGLRLGEVCALRWSDIDWDERTLRVQGTVQRLPRKSSDDERKTRLTITRPKTRCAERVIPLTARLATVLSERAGGRDAYILTGQERLFMDPRTMQNRFRRTLERLGIERVNFHAIRHTFATMCVRNNVDIKSLSEMLGHATVDITLNRYVHPSLEVKKRQMEHLCFTKAA